MQKIRNFVWSQDRHEAAKTRLLMASMLPRTSVPYTIAIATLVLLAAILPIMFTVAAGIVVGSVPDAVGRGLQSPEARRLFTALAFASGFYVLQQLIGQAQTGVALAFGRRFDTDMQARVMETLTEPAGVAHLEDPAMQDKLNTVRGWTLWYSAGDSIGAMATLASQFLQAFLATAILMRFSVPIALFFICELVFVSRPIWRLEIFRLVKVQLGQAQALRQADYYRDLILQPKAAKEIRVFGLVDWITDRFTSYWTGAMKQVWSDRTRGLRVSAVAMVCSWVPMTIVFVSLGLAASSGRLTLQELSIYAMAVFNAYAIYEIGPPELQVQYGQSSLPAERELAEMVSAGRLRGGTVDASGRPQRSIRFEGVAFAYPNSSRTVFDGLDLEIHAGQSLAIVGANGAGKTTLIKLLCRFYDPVAGRITVDDVDLREFDPVSWQHRIAAIFQDFAKYEFSARDNVAFGALSRSDEENLLDEAARRAGIEEIVAGLPSGWDTTLSRRYEGGAELSGGQWQRIAIARAIVGSAEKGVLILDEPTANLDVRGEAEIYGKFLELTRGLTTVLISHRFSTVRRADRIVVLEDGRVVEDGSHEELLSQGGRYAHMFRLQAARFEETSDV
jgi:ATP-binding cassette, subfamily B, bacterial